MQVFWPQSSSRACIDESGVSFTCLRCHASHPTSCCILSTTCRDARLLQFSKGKSMSHKFCSLKLSARCIPYMGAPFPRMKHALVDDALIICGRKSCHNVQIWRFEADLCQWKTCPYRKLRTFVSITNNVSDGISSVPNLLKMDWGENLVFVSHLHLLL